MNSTQHRWALSQAGKKVERARADLQEGMDQLKQEVIRARDSDIPVSHMARLTGLSRQTIYTIYKENT